MPGEEPLEDFRFTHPGFCPACEQQVVFSADGPYFRNTLICPACGTGPRHRALMATLVRYFPNWRELRIHESSAGWDKVSQRLVTECGRYLCSQYDLRVPFGETVPTDAPSGTYRSEDLEAQTFGDEIFDLVILQDVFEHILRPDLAIKEIARTLVEGGAVIMTVPIIKQLDPSIRRAAMVDGKLVHFHEPEYHGNPVGDEGSLVTIDWGYEIVSYLQHHSGLAFQMIKIDDIDRGIRADLNEVLIGFKRPIPVL